jgi:hypothetical protein
MGYVDLIFKLKLTNKDLLKSEEGQNQSEENAKSGQKLTINIIILKTLNQSRIYNS